MKKISINENDLSSLLTGERYRLYRHLIVQVIILAISVGVFFDAPDSVNLSPTRFYGWISYYLFMNMLVYVNALGLFPCFLAKNRFFPYLVSVVLFTLFALAVMILLQELFYDIAVTHRQPSGIAVFLSITSSMLAILLFLGGISALLLLKQWLTDNRKISDLRVATYQSELNFLKSQINPHFLFNMINNATVMADENPKVSSSILTKLDDLLQYQFNDSIKESVALKTDIGFMTDFLDLEKIRRDHFEFTLTVEGRIEGVELPPLLFIPFVENAAKHTLDAAVPYVRIRFKIEKNRLFFECENTKPSEPVRRNAGGLGLTNIRRRLELLFENKHVLDISETETTYRVNLQLYL